MRALKKVKARFKVGDWVKFHSPSKTHAQVIEDRGPLGNKGRTHIYRVRVDHLWAEPYLFEANEDSLEPAPPLDKEAISKYLGEGGLVAILRAHLGDEEPAPKVWLSYTSTGGVTHTFDAWRGVLGGAAVPYFALHERKVFKGKQDQVLDLLKSFELEREEAEEVVKAIGTGP